MTFSTLTRWASGYLEEVRRGAVPPDFEEVEIALAIYDRAFDNQMRGSRGIRELFPEGRRLPTPAQKFDDGLSAARIFKSTPEASGYQIGLKCVGRAIRDLVPLAGDSATDAEVVARNELVATALEQIGVRPGERTWYTQVCEEAPGELAPPFGGSWATSPEQSLIDTALWRPEFDDRHVARWIEPDPDAAVYNELRARKNRADRRRELDESAVTLW